MLSAWCGVVWCVMCGVQCVYLEVGLCCVVCSVCFVVRFCGLGRAICVLWGVVNVCVCVFGLTFVCGRVSLVFSGARCDPVFCVLCCVD